MRSRSTIAALVAILVSALVGGVYGKSAPVNADTVATHYKTFTSALTAIQTQYAEPVESDRMVYGAINENEDTIKAIAFKFVSEKDFLTALVRSVEGSTRGFVATKRQAEILGLRGEIVAEVKDNLDHVIETWGFHLIDLQ